MHPSFLVKWNIGIHHRKRCGPSVGKIISCPAPCFRKFSLSLKSMRQSINVNVHHGMAQNTAQSCHDTLCQITSHKRATIFTARFPTLFQVMGQNLIFPRSDRTGKLSAAHPSPIRKTGYTGGPHTSSSWNTFKVFVDRFWPLSNGFHTGGIRTRVNQPFFFHVSGGIPRRTAAGTALLLYKSCKPEPSSFPFGCLYPTIKSHDYHFKNAAKLDRILQLEAAYAILSQYPLIARLCLRLERQGYCALRGMRGIRAGMMSLRDPVFARLSSGALSLYSTPLYSRLRLRHKRQEDCDVRIQRTHPTV